jgi:hypothetical protein
MSFHDHWLGALTALSRFHTLHLETVGDAIDEVFLNAVGESKTLRTITLIDTPVVSWDFLDSRLNVTVDGLRRTDESCA